MTVGVSLLTIQIIGIANEFSQIDETVFERYCLRGCESLTVCRQRRDLKTALAAHQNRNPERRSLREEMIVKRFYLFAGAAAVALTGVSGTALAQKFDREVHIAGFGAKSGVVRSFGVNTEGMMRAAADKINAGGGIKLGDGKMGKVVVTFYDDRCRAEEGISVIRRIASGKFVVAVGPTCSNVAEPLFGILQKTVDDKSDSGLQFPIFTDTAIKGGLAKISAWAFRNVPNETAMYKNLFAWVKKKWPNLKTVYGGVEEDFAHSRFTWYKVMDKQAKAAGFKVLGRAKWLLADTNFTTQVRAMKKAKADIISISSHPFTLCGLLKEMRRQRVKYKVLIGLTSSSSMETLQGCARQAKGIIIPTSFAPITAAAKEASAGGAKYKASADLHSAAAWENMMVLKQVMESKGVMAKAGTIQADRRKIRDGLAALKNTQGLIGSIKRHKSGEATKPFVYVHAQGKEWKILHDPNK